MERWHGKVAVVTGASSGIGAAIVVDLLKAGLRVVGLARRVERVEQLRSLVPATIAQSLHVRQCDVSKEAEIVAAFQWVRQQLGGVDILVSNAGVVSQGNLVDAGNSDWLRQTIDVNLLAAVLCAREAFQSMKERQVAGHVVLMNSVTGHSVPSLPIGSLNIYSPTKYALTAVTEVLRQEFNSAQTKCKVTSISPGLVATEMVPDGMKETMPSLRAEDISAAVMYAIGTPAHVQVHELTIRPVGERF